MKRALLLAILLCLLIPACEGGVSRSVGYPCENNADCRELCARGGDFPGGHCTRSCFDNADCPVDAACVDEMGGICLLRCDSDAFCREILDTGYECRDRDTPDNRIELVCIGN